jgi:uncharacterized damage-inducible protein DinB
VDTATTVYGAHLRWVLWQLGQCLEELGEGLLGWRPADGTNSARVIAVHVVSVTRAYALGFGCGLTVTRDREAEFAAKDETLADLLAILRQLAGDVEAAFPALTSAALERTTVPAPELWGTGEPHAISARHAIVEAIRHASIHLGELRLVRHLALLGR